MKVVFAGGGTGGHFAPLIAVAEELQNIADAEKIIDLQMYFFSDTPYDTQALHERGIEYRSVPAGKMRLYFSLKTIPDTVRTIAGFFKACIEMFSVYPDVVFSKGGYAAFPVVCAARVFGIPVVMHDSDSVPGRVSIFTGKFAKKIALVYPEAIKYFKNPNVAITGLPIRRAVMHPQKEGAYEYLFLDPTVPTILVLGGSQGAEAINEIMLDAAVDLVEKYQIIHQAGDMHFESVNQEVRSRLSQSQFQNRYKVFGSLNTLALSMAAGISSIVITRAGSTLCEIAAWGLPSIVVPIPQSISRDQTTNAFSYARTGAAIVVEQQNLTHHILLNEITRLFAHKDIYDRMAAAAKSFARLDAAAVIAKELLIFGRKHELDL